MYILTDFQANLYEEKFCKEKFRENNLVKQTFFPRRPRLWPRQRSHHQGSDQAISDQTSFIFKEVLEGVLDIFMANCVLSLRCWTAWVTRRLRFLPMTSNHDYNPWTGPRLHPRMKIHFPGKTQCPWKKFRQSSLDTHIPWVLKNPNLPSKNSNTDPTIFGHFNRTTISNLRKVGPFEYFKGSFGLLSS